MCKWRFRTYAQVEILHNFAKFPHEHSFFSLHNVLHNLLPLDTSYCQLLMSSSETTESPS